MEVKDQLNQNSENIQEEKPKSAVKAAEENVVKTAKPVEVKHQIDKEEKQTIVDLLSGSVEPQKEVLAEADTQQTEVAVQIGNEEKDEISTMLKEQEEIPATDTTEQTAKETPQLADDEKESILKMLRGEIEVEAETEEQSKDELRQISEAERLEIARLISGRKIDIVKEVIGEKLDFEKLNKQELVEMIEQVVEEKNTSKIRDVIAKIKVAFHNKNKEDIEREKKEFIDNEGEEKEFKAIIGPLEHRYNSAFNIYKQNRVKFAQEFEKQKQENFKLKLQILEDLKVLIDSEETLKKTYDEFKILQIRWKEIGMIPASELRNLWQNYHFLVERFFDKVKINKELRDLDMKKNMEIKIGLCEKTEELLLEKSIIKSFKLLQKYHDKWREVGPAPTEHKEDLWERFKASTQKINERRKEHYKELQVEQERNYEAKVAMCEKAEELLVDLPTSLKIWHQQTDKMNEMLKLWKTIGRAARVQNDEIWIRFKSVLDKFFNARRDFLGQLKDQQTNNYNLKLDMCVQAEALKGNENWNDTTKALINLQKEWKKVGPVPRRQADKIWKRFRSACDDFFGNKKDHFKNIHGLEDDNLKIKQSLIEEIKSFKVSKEKSVNLEALKSVQSRWMETGHVPFAIKDKLQTQYREAVDNLIDKMDINKNELSTSGFQSKIEMLKSAPDANRRISKERGFVSGKIRSLQEDLQVLENNIGFFSSSKQSNILKQEFEKKIEKAKKEINSLKDKLKILDA